MSNYKYTKKCALLVSTSDNYETAWLPYFELIKKYWPNRPENIYLNTETKQYYDPDIKIKNILSNKEDCTWSERLYNCLMQVEEEYVFFSLEDFFLLGNVKDNVLEKCLNWMEENKSIAVCRIMPSNLQVLSISEYEDFRIAGDDTPYRLDTQFALWRKKDLLSFIDLSENPWQFETNGTQRIIGTKKIFLWAYSSTIEDQSLSAFPYHIQQNNGYGIAWGRWLWNNKKWFIENGIKGVNYNKLGVLSERAVKMRYKYLYRPGKEPAKGFEKIIQKIYKFIDRIQKAFALIRLRGFKEGIKEIKKRRENK